MNNEYDDRLSDGTPCMKTEVAGLANDSFSGKFSRWFADKFLNMGRNDPMRKSAVFHDRLCDLVRLGEMTQDRADELYELAVEAEAEGRPLGWLRAHNRYAIVRVLSFFRSAK
jgi:hypothetical protein